MNPRRNVNNKLTSTTFSLVLVSGPFKHLSGVPNLKEAEVAVEEVKVLVMVIALTLYHNSMFHYSIIHNR